MTTFSLEVHTDNLVNKPLERYVHVVGALDGQELQPAGIVESLEADPVLLVDGAVPEGEDQVFGAREVELKVLGLLGLDHPVL